jgi:hypothetical protein
MRDGFARWHPDRTPIEAGRSRGPRRLPCFAACRLHHRLGISRWSALSMPTRTATRARGLWSLHNGIVNLRAIPKTKCSRELADDVFIDRPLHNDSSVDDPDKSAQIHMAMVAMQPT